MNGRIKGGNDNQLGWPGELELQPGSPDIKKRRQSVRFMVWTNESVDKWFKSFYSQDLRPFSLIKIGFDSTKYSDPYERIRSDFKQL